MPQLDSSWFASQIFWLLIGFCILYLFVVKNFTPRVREIVAERNSYIDELQRKASKISNEALQIQNESEIMLEDFMSELRVKEYNQIKAHNFEIDGKKEILLEDFNKKISAFEVKLNDNFAQLKNDIDVDEIVVLAAKNLGIEVK